MQMLFKQNARYLHSTARLSMLSGYLILNRQTHLRTFVLGNEVDRSTVVGGCVVGAFKG